MNKKNLDNITIIDDIFDEQYLNILNNEYDNLEKNVYKTKTSSSINPPSDYMKSLNTSIYNPMIESKDIKRVESLQSVINNDIEKMNKQNKFYVNKEENISAGDVPLLKNINGQDSIKMYEPNKFTNSFLQTKSIPQQQNYPPPQNYPIPQQQNYPINADIDRPNRRLREQSCMDYIYHVEKCPACKRFFSYEKNMYLTVTIMIIILSIIIISFLMNELSKKK